MSFQDTFIGTVIGGAISGIIGFLTTRYDRRLVRREAHLQEHRENLRPIEQALVSLKEQLWLPSAKGVEDLWLPRWNQAPLGTWLKGFSIQDFVSVERLGNERFSTIAIDRILYSDMDNHFPKLYSMLAKIEHRSRTDGFRLGELLFEVSKAVYERLSSSNLSVLKWTFDKGERTSIRDIVSVDSNESQWYAGAIFLMLTGEDTRNWPNESAQLKKYGLFESLESLAKGIGTTLGNKVSEMLELRRSCFNAIDDCMQVIEETSHRMKLEGKCEYA